MSLFKGKNGIILGVANERSLASGIAEVLHKEGARLGFNFNPDDRGKMEARVKKAIGHLDPAFIHPCNVNKDEEVAAFFETASQTLGKLDFLVHSIAFAPMDEIRKPTLEVSRHGFLTAMEASVYSFILTAREAASRMTETGSILTLSYYGGEKVVGGYNLMGVAKSALESSVKYLAYDLGPRNIRINAISAGPVKTLAAAGIGSFSKMLDINASVAPLHRNVSTAEIGRAASFLLSDMSSGTTGEVLHVDCGYNIMGSFVPR